MLPPESISPSKLSFETGISKSTLATWKTKATVSQIKSTNTSNILDNSWAIACWINLSCAVGIPKNLTPPSGLDISFLLTGDGLYLFSSSLVVAEFYCWELIFFYCTSSTAAVFITADC